MAMKLKHDAEGFLLGEAPVAGSASVGRALDLWRGIKDDTAAIRTALSGGVKIALPQAANRPNKGMANTARLRPAAEPAGQAANDGPLRAAVASAPNSDSWRRQAYKTPEPESRGKNAIAAKAMMAARQTVASPSKAGATVAAARRAESAQTSQKPAAQDSPPRNSSGRFIKRGLDADNDKSEGGGWLSTAFEKLTDTIKDSAPSIGGMDQIDPAIAAANEVKGVMAPVAGGLALAGRGMWSFLKWSYGGGQGKKDAAIPWYRRIWDELRKANDKDGEAGGGGLLGRLLPMLMSAMGVLLGLPKMLATSLLGWLSNLHGLGALSSLSRGRLPDRRSQNIDLDFPEGQQRQQGSNGQPGTPTGKNSLWSKTKKAAGRLMRGLKPSLGGLLRAGPMALLSAGDSIWDTESDDTLSREEKNDQHVKTGAGAAGGWAGGAIGAKIGAAIGTAIFPGVGTAIGGVLGGLVGGVTGWLAGDKLGDWVNDLRHSNLIGRMIGVWDTTIKWWKGAWDDTIAGAGKAFDAVKKWAGEKVEAAEETLSDAYGGAKAMAFDAAAAVKQAAGTVAGHAAAGGRTLFNHADNATGGVLRKIANLYRGESKGIAKGIYTEAEQAHVETGRQNGEKFRGGSGISDEIREKITAAEREGDIPPGFLLASAQLESGGNPNAVSPTGATGLFQFTSKTARSLGLPNRFDVDANIAAGVRLTKENMQALGTRDPNKLYLALQQGAPGAKKILQAAKAGGSVDEQTLQNMSVNYGKMSAADYVATVNKKMAAAQAKVGYPTATATSPAAETSAARANMATKAGPSTMSPASVERMAMPKVMPTAVRSVVPGRGAPSLLQQKTAALPTSSTAIPPAPPPAMTRLGSSGSDSAKNITVTLPNSIGQNVTDRGIAHIKTGGMGGFTSSTIGIRG